MDLHFHCFLPKRFLRFCVTLYSIMHFIVYKRNVPELGKGLPPLFPVLCHFLSIPKENVKVAPLSILYGPETKEDREAPEIARLLCVTGPPTP